MLIRYDINSFVVTSNRIFAEMLRWSSRNDSARRDMPEVALILPCRLPLSTGSVSATESPLLGLLQLSTDGEKLPAGTATCLLGAGGRE